MDLADSGYRGALLSLGNKPGEQRGDVTVTLVNNASVTLPSASCTWIGSLGLVAKLPDGRQAFWPAAAVLSVVDAQPG